MVNNFNLIEQFLPENQVGNLVYHLMILKRKKDHPHLTHKNNTARVIKSYAIKDRNHLKNVKDDIIAISEATQSRIMINLSPKDMKKMSWELLKTLADYIQSEQFNSKLYRITDAVLGAMKPEKNSKLFLWDVDGDVDELHKWAEILEECKAETVITVPTKNGWHIHTKPFNYTKIKGEKIDMHKNNPTILYIPKSLDKEMVCYCGYDSDESDFELINEFNTGYLTSYEKTGIKKVKEFICPKCKTKFIVEEYENY